MSALRLDTAPSAANSLVRVTVASVLATRAGCRASCLHPWSLSLPAKRPPHIRPSPAGYLPVRLEALPEGTCVNARVPLFQITAEGEYAPLCTYLETLLVQVWYPATVATLRWAAPCEMMMFWWARVWCGWWGCV